jgi:CRISPR-associated protein Csb2
MAVALEGMGGLDHVGLPSEGVSWRSVTPFLPQRHRHPRRESFDEFMVDCLGRELRARGIDLPFRLEPEPTTSWGSFRRYRRTERLHHARAGFGFTLYFDKLVSGPLCLGQLSHFGMGRFEPCPT